MARKSQTPNPNPNPEENPPPESELNDALNAGDANAQSEPTIELQPPGSYPSVEDIFADMAEPPPTPLLRYSSLPHTGRLPGCSFRVQRRLMKGTFIWMFALPYGDATPGKAFVHPFAAHLRAQLGRECPQLVQKRFEIRLVYASNGMHSLLEVPADPAPTARSEETRQALLRVIAQAEMEWVVAEKVGGRYQAKPALYDLPVSWPPDQTVHELTALSYLEFVSEIGHPILQPYRTKL
jgi:hypothetical protein